MTGLPQAAQNSCAPKGEDSMPAHTLPSSSLDISLPQASHVEIVIGMPSAASRLPLPAPVRAVAIVVRPADDIHNDPEDDECD
jgi:hypothetical protein